MHPQISRLRIALIVASLAIFGIVLSSHAYWGGQDSNALRFLRSGQSSETYVKLPWSTTAGEAMPQVPLRRHVAVATSFWPHMEVYMPVTWTFGKVLGADSTLQVYANPLGGEYGSVAEEIGMYDMTGRGLKGPEMLIQDINNNTLFGEDDGMIDVVVFGTCEIE